MTLRRLGLVRSQNDACRGLPGADQVSGFLGHHADDGVDVVGRVDAGRDFGQPLELSGPSPVASCHFLPFFLGFLSIRDVAKHQDDARRLPPFVLDRGDAIVDGPPGPVSGDKHPVVPRGPGIRPVAEHVADRGRSALRIVFVDDDENLFESSCPAPRPCSSPSAPRQRHS